MKTAISIPDPIFEKAEELAKRLEISRSELYSRAVKEFVEERSGRWVTESLNEIYSDESSDIDSVLVAIQSASLPDEDW